MPTYTVYAPPPRPDTAASDPQRFVFVRDGFYFWAFLLAPLWLLVHRLWLVLVLYVVVDAVSGTALVLLGAPWLAKSLVGLLIALLIGFEAATLWRWTLARRGWRMLGFAVGEDAEAAEWRFFAQWVKRTSATPPLPPPPARPHTSAPVTRGAPSGSGVIGLFPEPGGAP
jgi:Protein of unknown function (DUF2628)